MIRDPSSQPVIRRATTIQPTALDADAVRVVERLQSAGFEAYLVGGCVRDLLLGRQPKDFDVATDARPRQIRKLFRSCRIIGRRFKLAHVVFRRPDGGEHIIETATFRRAPRPSEVAEDGSLLITDDNVFGSAAEDAARRDFTINALFFDPKTWQILDFVGGLPDVAKLRLETIGDPNIRLREDPVRILRAVKFASRLGFTIEPETFEAMIRHAEDLRMSALPRILEEILRLMRSGSAFAAFRLLAECEALGVILPDLARYLTLEAERGAEGQLQVDLFWRDLEALDDAVRAGDPVTSAFLHSLLLYRLYERESDPSRRRARHALRDPFQVADEVFDPYARHLRMPRFDLARGKQICAVQPRFLSRPLKRFRPVGFVAQEYFPEALALFRAHCWAADANWDIYDAWYHLYRRRLAHGRHENYDATGAEQRLERLPIESTSFEELWNLPTRAPHEEREHSHPPHAAAHSRILPAPPSHDRGRGREATRDPRREPHRPREREHGRTREREPDRGGPRLEEVGSQRPDATSPAENERAPEPEPKLPFAPELLAAAVPSEPETMEWPDEPAQTPSGVPILRREIRTDVRERERREPPRFKITRPDSKFEFAEGPTVKIEDGPEFGDW